MHMGYPMFIQYLSLYCRALNPFMSRSPSLSSLWLAASTCWDESSSPPVSGQQRYIYYPLQVPSAPTGQISTWKHRFQVESTYAAGRRGSNVY